MFLTAFLPVHIVLDAMEASVEGDEGNESADGEHEESNIAQSWHMPTDQGMANLLVF
jgi:hypothetical protein